MKLNTLEYACLPLSSNFISFILVFFSHEFTPNYEAINKERQKHYIVITLLCNMC